MLVQCEFYQVGKKVVCDAICERCGEIAKKNQTQKQIADMVYAGIPVLCEACEEAKCPKCGKFPLPEERWPSGALCHRCHYREDEQVFMDWLVGEFFGDL